jgi:hypothetical protein
MSDGEDWHETIEGADEADTFPDELVWWSRSKGVRRSLGPIPRGRNDTSRAVRQLVRSGHGVTRSRITGHWSDLKSQCSRRQDRQPAYRRPEGRLIGMPMSRLVERFWEAGRSWLRVIA